MPYMSIQSDSYPFLLFGGSQAVMPWSHGTIYSLRMKSTYIRITRRGLQYSRCAEVPKMSTSIWKAAACLPAEDGLCALSSDAGSMLWFPNTQVDIPDDFSLIPRNAYLDRFANGSACSSSATSRSVKMHDKRYEVSLCDLLDANLDIVYMHGMVYWREDSTGFVVYLLISLTCVYLISCMSENIVSSMQGGRVAGFEHQKYTVYWSVCLVAYLLLTDNTIGLLLTEQDYNLTCHLFLYVCVQTAAQHYYNASAAHASRISLLTACISLLTVRVHYSFDNPYTLVLTLMFGTRSLYKFLAAVSMSMRKGEWALLLLDMFTYCSMLENGLMASSTDSFRGSAAQMVAMLVSFLLALLIIVYTGRFAVT